MNKVEDLGQVFTPEIIVDKMIDMIENKKCKKLEPSCGDGAFFNKLKKCTGIEFDRDVCPENALCMDFFDYSIDNKFKVIIGNPPYIGYKMILPDTYSKLSLYNDIFDDRANLYLYFIYKSILHLKQNGEIVFITPRDFIKNTSAMRLNEYMYKHGTITHFYETGDDNIFKGYSPNCAIWRYELDNIDHKTITNNGIKNYLVENGQIFFIDAKYNMKFSDLFDVKVGAVSGMDEIFRNENGNEDFVYSGTFKTGDTIKMFYNIENNYLKQHKDVLINRKIKKFNENNWWEWGRKHYISDKPRIYVNAKTRNKNPFFIHECKNYDGSILAIFPKIKTTKSQLKNICDALNKVDWEELGFVVDGRFIFSQRALQNTFLPDFLMDVI